MVTKLKYSTLIATQVFFFSPSSFSFFLEKGDGGGGIIFQDLESGLSLWKSSTIILITLE